MRNSIAVHGWKIEIGKKRFVRDETNFQFLVSNFGVT